MRHYHQIGLLPEPERDASGYRSYAAPDVVRLIRIRTLAEAGVPLARVQELLGADEDGFAARSPTSTPGCARRSGSCRSTGAGSRGWRPATASRCRPR